MTTLETIYTAFQKNPTRLSYSTKSLCKQFTATEDDIKRAKYLYKLNSKDYTVACALAMTKNLEEDAVWAGEYSPVQTKVRSWIPDSEKDKTFSDLFKEDDSEWEVKQKWVKGPEGSQLMVKKESITDYKKEFTDFVNNYRGFKSYTKKYNSSATDNLAVVCMFDMHLGKIAHWNYTGNQDGFYEQGQYFEEFDNLLRFLEQQHVDCIYLPIGNDLFNVDDTRLTTVKGTLQDNTHDLHGMFHLGMELITFSIDALVQIAPVKVILVPGNHASNSETYLAVAIDSVYKNNPNVEVDHRPIGRKYYSYGKNLIGFSHGELPLKKYTELLPYEAKEQFGNAEHIEVLVGDKHIEELHKNHIADGEGITVRRLAALTKTDKWHYQQGYVLSKRRSYVLIYNATEGLVLQYTNTAKV